MQTIQQVVGNRYQILDTIGSGSMGKVYRAADRLSSQTVALKRVTVAGERLQFDRRDSQDEGNTMRVALAQEFKVLASLRHPHIISVLNYGFDVHRQPYFAMELLEGAQTIIQAGRRKPIQTQVEYLVQMLQALAYLHRRGIIHRDLKPSNVLVTGDRVRVLDFGLSVPREDAHGRFGTVAYMSPEILQKGQAGEASDLYAVGVMAYELITGAHPFDVDSKRLIRDILKSDVDLSVLSDELSPIIGRLLAKDPAERYADAQEVIQELCAAIGQPAPEEDQAIRDSYLQAARFVGRETELEQCIAALDQALEGQGSGWLVGGESGVGKTRLLEELRIRALVSGALVLTGQGVEGGGLAYQLWREPLRRLALSTDLDDLEAGVLKPILPELEDLLGREIPAAPVLEGQAAQHRLTLTIADVFRKSARAAQPVVLILEDLQWAAESLEPLNPLLRLIEDAPLLIIGSYRSDERPGLPDELPKMQILHLSRFDEAQISELSVSMLGEKGSQPHVLNLLNLETEGNVFFLVETMRALAEEAGRLDEVGRMTLPKTVFAGGVRQIVQRRLGRVPAGDRPLLKLAAVAGRALDLEVLQGVMPKTDLETWLTTCANVAVLEVIEGRWQFVHDKLRESLIDNLDEDERPALHGQIAIALEETYPQDPQHAAALAEHWYAAGEMDQAAHYSRNAGEYAAAHFANQDAVRHLSRALELTPETEVKKVYEIVLARQRVYGLQGERETQADDLARLAELAESLGDEQRAEIALEKSKYAFATGDFPATVQAAQTAVRLSKANQDMGSLAEGYYQWGRGLRRLGEYEKSRKITTLALETAGEAQMLKTWADILRSLASIPTEPFDHAAMQESYKQALKAYRDPQVNDRVGIAWSLNNLAVMDFYSGDYSDSRAQLEQSLDAFQQIGDRYGLAQALINYGKLFWLLGDRPKASEYINQALHICRQTGDRRSEGSATRFKGLIALHEGDRSTAKQYFHQALEINLEIGDRQTAFQTRSGLGRVLTNQGQYAEAIEILQEILAPSEGSPDSAPETRAWLACALLGQGNLPQAAAYIEILVETMETRVLTFLEEPFRLYLICYQVLQANQDPRAWNVLDKAYALLQEQAANIRDEELRKSFMENVPANRELVIEWNEVAQGLDHRTDDKT